ncbi:hypothetical protein LTR53_015121 [Teratosphaeriaceae sp. CCFEE 6253]|nr:hypothetical protein LTR53_015121 [Teratosphaeriaceae sp. CCFEE 6253]
MSDAPSPPSSDLSDPPSNESDHDDDNLSTAIPSSRPSPPAKRRRTANPNTITHTIYTREYDDFDSAANPDWDTISLSTDSLASAPGSPSHDEWSLREEAQTECLWRGCDFGVAAHNDDLVQHVQATHCATGGPKRSKYVCEWGECQRKQSNHPSGYALKAHMRSHTKEKPYYCALPECDKAFTRSDALAKHMRTVHEPEVPRGAVPVDAPVVGKGKGAKPGKAAMGNGVGANGAYAKAGDGGPAFAHDDRDHPFPSAYAQPSPASDNITYIPAHHPITRQPGFMIHYPPDINFTAWESSVSADALMRLLRRQIHWAEREHEELESECRELEHAKREEWALKEVLLEGSMECEWARARLGSGGLLREVTGTRAEGMMERDAEIATEGLGWGPRSPPWRAVGFVQDPGQGRGKPRREMEQPWGFADDPGVRRAEEDDSDDEIDDDDEDEEDRTAAGQTRPTQRAETPERARHITTPSPPPTGKSGGFDGEGDPYDNFYVDQMARMQEMRAKRDRDRAGGAGGGGGGIGAGQAEMELDAVGVLMGMSGGRAS